MRINNPENKKIVERSIYQVFDNIPYEFYKDEDFAKNFIERLFELSISYDDISAGIKIACEKRSHPELCELLLKEIQYQKAINNNLVSAEV